MKYWIFYLKGNKATAEETDHSRSVCCYGNMCPKPAVQMNLILKPGPTMTPTLQPWGSVSVKLSNQTETVLFFIVL